MQEPLIKMDKFCVVCPICLDLKNFNAADDFWYGRDGLSSKDCKYNGCMTRERALAYVLRSDNSDRKLRQAHIHESSPADRGLSAWMKMFCPNYVQTGLFPSLALGSFVGTIRNENLEMQTFADASFDLVIHLDVMEHLFNPFSALREIYRTLVPNGKCIFSAPTQPDLLTSCQVAFRNEDGTITIVGEPEYHGNPQDEFGSLVTWRYGYDLPLLISRETDFDVEVRRFQSKRAAATGIMNEIYVLSK